MNNNIVCPCFNITTNELKSVISKYPNLSFSEFLEKTQAGSKCTACTLDIEYLFVELTNNKPMTSIGPRSLGIKPPVKQRIYKIFDKFTPMVPMIQSNYVPIIAGKDIESWIWIANYSMMYEKQITGVEMDIELTVRNNLGVILHNKKYFLDKETHIRKNVSQFLLNNSNTDKKKIFGSLEIKRIPRKIGFRGTTRPQIEILAKNGNGMVHAQGVSSSESGGFSCIYRPEVDTVFIVITNTGTKKMDFCISYPINNNIDMNNNVKNTISIPPNNTIFHKINLKGVLHNKYLNQLINIKWNSKGLRSSFAICASKGMDQFSMDHVD